MVNLNTGALQLRRQRRDSTLLLLSKTGLQLGNQRGNINLDTLLLGVSFGQTHLLDTALTSSELFLAEDNAEGDGALFGGLELLGQFGLQLVRELGLKCMLVFVQIDMDVNGLLTLMPALHSFWQISMRSFNMPLKPLPPKAMT